MKASLALMGLLIAVGSFNARAAELLHLVQDGVEIDAGSVGKFTLEYPTFFDGASKEAHKLVQKNVAGKTATLKYEGGAQVVLSLGDAGKVALKLSQIPADVKSLHLDMHIPITFNQGGTWKFADKGGEFPKLKDKPHLYQGGSTSFELHNYEGRGLAFHLPDYSYQQLQDNREWNWPIFHWQSITPYDQGHPELTVTVAMTGAASGAKTGPLVDQFGQFTREEWPDKVKSLAELQSDVAAEKAYYDSLHPPQRDTYGGLPGSGEKLGLKKTGFFHTEKKSDRWLLVDPEGNAFFHLGLCAVNPSDDYTLVKGRETTYAWLPSSTGEFATAFRPDSGGTILSFHLANQIRKYGHPYSLDDYVDRMIGRMRKWGFNSIGAFSGGAQAVLQKEHFPTVAHLQLNAWEGVPRIPGIHETIDPFDEAVRAKVRSNLAESLPARAADPLIIGYFIVNEPLYEDIPKVVPSLKGTFACKRRLVQWLADKYQTIAAFNTAWGMQAASFEELKDAGLPLKATAATQDMQAFTSVFLDEYFRLIAETYHQYDKNHLLIGSRLQPGTINNEALCRIAGKYLDVMSFNYYTEGVDKEFLRRIYGWTGGRPMMLSEFFWSSPKDSSLSGGREVASQQERGLAYRNYVEQSATLGFVVGIEWFTLVDQSATGRWFEGIGGEGANSGVIAVTDRPWKPMLTEVMKTNYDIYKVLFGERPPYVFENAKFKNKEK